MTPRIWTGRDTPRFTRSAIQIVKGDEERARSFAAETHTPDDSDRALVMRLARNKGLPLTPILRAWAEMDNARARAA